MHNREQDSFLTMATSEIPVMVDWQSLDQAPSTCRSRYGEDHKACRPSRSWHRTRHARTCSSCGSHSCPRRLRRDSILKRVRQRRVYVTSRCVAFARLPRSVNLRASRWTQCLRRGVCYGRMRLFPRSPSTAPQHNALVTQARSLVVTSGRAKNTRGRSQIVFDLIRWINI